MEHVKTWQERCEEDPAHAVLCVSQGMIQAKMQEEIDDLRDLLCEYEIRITALRDAVKTLKEKNTTLRYIMSHIDGRAVIQAREKAGHGIQIRAASTQEGL